MVEALPVWVGGGVVGELRLVDDPARVLVEDGDNAFILNGLNRDGLRIAKRRWERVKVC